jgi:hypothetical protein
MPSWVIEPAPKDFRGYRQTKRRELLEKLIALANTGRALRLTTEEYGPPTAVRQTMHNLAKRRGYDYHAQGLKKDGSYLAWVTKHTNGARP